MNDKEIIDSAKILEEAVRESERIKLLLNEVSVGIPMNNYEMEKMRALPSDNISTRMASYGGVKLVVRRSIDAGHGGSPSQHACSVKLYKTANSKTDTSIPIAVPRRSYLNIPKMLPDKKILKNYGKDGRAAMRLVFDCQALLIAIWDSKSDHETNILYEMLRDKMSENDYYHNNKIKGPKTQEELDKDMKEIAARIGRKKEK